ncbi:MULTISPECIES: ribosome biogenesis GTPase Der [unclassified Campylobacter]|uniref:ribosome biogenesis GTPase Der n=1 Tax=unclassified Campylobacter TaxID=2593542 RepID=UPI0022E9AE88|nr:MULTISPECIES: ribosome biogenesis GTPase Der [unclassified Campylobacter]MDA3043613.1 ribosome biogenesis GTPase Der [Campylobacter sp. JMF_09 ED2]MDA3045353.1 ribosome biogenesis GTPase Der [Campylobacter sp. JMF_07 ED4]MDA3064621.1 ribosome biogenesis GTPase Der [Campylobacter sp. JMF_11 EL3]MDA3072550.1 ribosome biogenesis GTPase Der [Campylobacter sp. VBCF_03 NA9]MDA3075481.1 ribosome biogenesis GTPase Der [Campylobacter sp. JMF_05 ED3]
MKTVMIIGRPNVGKSSLFNRFANARIAITSEVSGTTRDTNKIAVQIYDRNAMIVDSGGLDDTSELFARVQAKTLAEAQNADIILFMVDGKLLPDEQDRKIFFSLQKLGKPIVLLVNKVDSKKDEERSWEFNEFGAQMFALSVSHNVGIDELRDWIYTHLDPAPVRGDESEDFDDFLENFDDNGEIKESDESEYYENKTINVGIIGRVNVGKSSLLNALVKNERSVVSSVAGTTIDPVNESYEFEGRRFEFVDTAGIRKRGKIEGIERFALNRTEKILENSDIALLVLDSSEPFSELDERIAGLAAKFELGVIIVLNKWDKSEAEFDAMVRDLRDKFKFLAYAPVISVSALGGKRIHKLYPLILQVYKNYTQKIKTAHLNALIEEATKAHPLPHDKGKSVKIYYAAQFGFAPPKIALVMNRPRALHFSYKRYLANKLREKFDLSGTPLVIIPKNRGNDDEGEANLKKGQK